MPDNCLDARTKIIAKEGIAVGGLRNRDGAAARHWETRPQSKVKEFRVNISTSSPSETLFRTAMASLAHPPRTSNSNLSRGAEEVFGPSLWSGLLASNASQPRPAELCHSGAVHLAAAASMELACAGK